MGRSPVLTLSDAVRAFTALDELHRVCLAMDADRQDDRPSEEEYQAVMANACEALKVWAPHRMRQARNATERSA